MTDEENNEHGQDCAYPRMTKADAIAQRIRDKKVLCVLVAHNELTSDVPMFASNKKEVAVAKRITGLEETWNSKARANYEKAAELAAQAAALAR